LCPIETEVYNFLIYLDYCIFTIRRFSQWYKVNVLYLCFICYRICCQLHTVFILMALYNESQLLWCVDQHLGVKPPPAKIQYVDGCKTECIIYLKRCRNYKKLLVVPTDSPYSLGANERLTLIHWIRLHGHVIFTYEFASQSVWMFLLLQLFYFIKYLQSYNDLTGAGFHTMFY